MKLLYYYKFIHILYSFGTISKRSLYFKVTLILLYRKIANYNLNENVYAFIDNSTHKGLTI